MRAERARKEKRRGPGQARRKESPSAALIHSSTLTFVVRGEGGLLDGDVDGHCEACACVWIGGAGGAGLRREKARNVKMKVEKSGDAQLHSSRLLTFGMRPLLAATRPAPRPAGTLAAGTRPRSLHPFACVYNRSTGLRPPSLHALRLCAGVIPQRPEGRRGAGAACTLT